MADKNRFASAKVEQDIIDAQSYKGSYFDSGSSSIVTLINNTPNGRIAYYYVENSGVLTDWTPSDVCYYMTVCVIKFNGAVSNVIINGVISGGAPIQFDISGINGVLAWGRVDLLTV